MTQVFTSLPDTPDIWPTPWHSSFLVQLYLLIAPLRIRTHLRPQRNVILTLVYLSSQNFHLTMAQQTLRYVFGKWTAYQHLRWLIQVMRFSFFEVQPQSQVISTAQFLQLLVQRFRPYSQSYQVSYISMFDISYIRGVTNPAADALSSLEFRIAVSDSWEA